MKNESAFTLLETLIYMGLLSILMTGSISSMYAIGATSARISADTRIHDEGRGILSTLRYEWENSGATYTQQTFSYTTGTWTIRTSQLLTFYIASSSLMRKKNGRVENISSTNVAVDSFTVSNAKRTSSTPQTIHISLTLSATSTEGVHHSQMFSESFFPLQ